MDSNLKLNTTSSAATTSTTNIIPTSSNLSTSSFITTTANKSNLETTSQKQSLTSLKSSPRKPYERKISQAKSIDIECIAMTDDDDDDDNNNDINDCLIAQNNKNNNKYLSFEYDKLNINNSNSRTHSRPNSLRYTKETNETINDHYIINNNIQTNSNVNLDSKYLSNPILSNEKRKISFKKSPHDLKQRSFDSTNVLNDNKQQYYKNQLPNNNNNNNNVKNSNNSVFFRNKPPEISIPFSSKYTQIYI
jgi:hypothetical protein